MAKVLCILGNARRDGYTIKVLNEAAIGARSIKGVETELIYLLSYSFGPCTSCYHCIRDPDHRCLLPDDMGKNGDLWRKIEEANGLILASPVHFWTADALMHMFIERLYPFLWSGKLKGIPAATIAVASNQGFHVSANRTLCKWAFTLGMKYVGGLPVHAVEMEAALLKARRLGIKVAEAALKDAREGRKPMTDIERWLEYQDKPWKVYPRYIENLTSGTFNPDFSIIGEFLVRGTFKKEEARRLLENAEREFQIFKHHYSIQNHREAIKHLVKASAFWTHATWKEFLEHIIGVSPPKTYRRI